MKTNWILIFTVLALVLFGFSEGEDHTRDTGCKDCVSFTLEILNESSILVKSDSVTDFSVSFDNEYSNARPYIELLEPYHDSFAQTTLRARNASYLIHFPIYWYKSLPYGVLTTKSGIVESTFLFPRTNTSKFSITSDTAIFISGIGRGKQFEIKKADLENSYIVFGNSDVRCSRSYGNISVSIMSLDDFSWNNSYCDGVFSIVDYYSSEFGDRLQSNYTITFSKARSYASLPSGFFVNEYDLTFIAHELFHSWQPQNECMENIFYKEGLATYMAQYAQLRLGIITKDEFDLTLNDYRNRLFSIENISSLYFEHNLNELRKLDPQSHGLLMYAKGALLWDMIEKENNTNNIFFLSLDENQCDEISKLLSEHEQKIYGD